MQLQHSQTIMVKCKKMPLQTNPNSQFSGETCSTGNMGEETVFGREHGILSIGINIHLSSAACEMYISDDDDKALAGVNILDDATSGCMISSCRSSGGSSAMNLCRSEPALPEEGQVVRGIPISGCWRL